MPKRKLFRDYYLLGEVGTDSSGRNFVGPGSGRAITQAELRGVEHLDGPDEMLRVAIITDALKDRYASKRSEWKARFSSAWEKALAESEEEGVLWTPVMDAVGHTNDRFARYAYGNPEPLDKRILGQIGKIEKEIRGRPMKELLAATRNFDFKPLHSAVLRVGENIEDLDTSDIAHLLADGDIIGSLIGNKNLTQVACERLVEIFWGDNGKICATVDETFAKTNASGLMDLSSKMISLGGLSPEKTKELVNGHPGTTELVAMAQAHPDMDARILRLIVEGDNFSITDKIEALRDHRAKDLALEWIGNTHISSIKAIWRGVLMQVQRGGEVDLVQKIADSWTVSSGGLEIAKMLIKDVRVSDLDALRIGKAVEAEKMWTHNDKADIRRALAKREIVRKDKDLWNVLKNSQNQEVLVGMVEGAKTTEELTRAVKRLEKSSTWRLLNVLKELQIPSGVKPPQKLLAPVLAHGNARERETAIGILGRWGKLGGTTGAENRETGTSRKI